MSADPASSTPEDTFSEAAEIAKRLHTSVSTWYRWVARKIAPQPVLHNPRRWSDVAVVAWEASILTVEQVEAATWPDIFGDPNLPEFGKLVWAQNSGVCPETFSDWQNAGLIKEDRDCVRKLSKRSRQGSPRLIELVYLVKQSITAIRKTETERRSTSAIERWQSKGTLREGSDLLLRRRHVRKLLGITNRTLDRWTAEPDETDGSDGPDKTNGCPYLGGSALSTTWRDRDGNHVLPPSDTKRGPINGTRELDALQYWYLSEITKVRNIRKALTTNVVDPELYSLDKTAELTGIARSTLKNKRTLTKSMGLEAVVKRVRHTCKRKPRGAWRPWKRVKNLWVIRTRRTYFTKTSVDGYARDHPDEPGLRKGSPGTMTTAEADAELGIQVSCQWTKQGLLEGELETYYTSHGLREGYRPAKESVAAAKKLIDEIRGSEVSPRYSLIGAARKARRILMAQRDERKRQQADAGQRETNAADPAPSSRSADRTPADPTAPTGTGRRVDPKNVPIYRTCAIAYRRVLASEIKMRKAVAIVLEAHGDDALGMGPKGEDPKKRLERQKTRLRMNAKMYEKHRQSWGERN
jgi:hypothetical protein